MKKKQKMADAIRKAEALDIKNKTYSKGKEKSADCGCGGKPKMSQGTARGGCGYDGANQGLQEGGKMTKPGQGISTTDHMREKVAGFGYNRAASIKNALAKESAIKAKM